MRKTIAAVSIAVGGLGVLGLGATIAGAQDEPTDTTDMTATTEGDAPAQGRGAWVDDALAGLVEDGTLTQDQADAVAGALEDARPAFGGHGPGGRGPGFGGPWFGGGGALAEALGVEEDALRDALRDGRTIAEVAEEQGVEVQDVVDALVAAQQERVDEAVADGDLTQEDADELMAGAEDRATALVNGERPDPEDRPDLDGEGRGPWGGGPGRWHDDDAGGEDQDGDADDDAGGEDQDGDADSDADAGS